jgi:putative heme degradation protein
MQTTSSLRDNPDALLAAWRDLTAKHPHLHTPQAALMLGVPEAALIAARLGTGAIALQPDVGALLATASQWRRVLIAVRSAAGVWLGFDHIDGVETQDWISLQGRSVITAKVRASAVAHAFWFEDEDDMHGRTQSLQLFNDAGRDVAKVLILHKSAAQDARTRFQGLALSRQRRLAMQVARWVRSCGRLRGSLTILSSKTPTLTPQAPIAARSNAQSAMRPPHTPTLCR